MWLLVLAVMELWSCQCLCRGGFDDAVVIGSFRAGVYFKLLLKISPLFVCLNVPHHKMLSYRTIRRVSRWRYVYLSVHLCV